MNYNYITYIPLETCIGNSLETFNDNFTSLDLNIKELSSSVESRTNFLSSTLQSVSATLDNRIQYLSTQIPVISGGIEEQLNFASIVSSGPNNDVPVLLYSKNINYENVDTGIVAKGNGATLTQAPDNTLEGGAKRGEYVTDFQRVRSDIGSVAKGDYGVLLNGYSNKIESDYSFVGAGSTNTISSISSNYSFVGAGENNLINGDCCSVLCGTGNSALNTYIVCVGQTNDISKYACMSFGNNNTNSISPSAIKHVDYSYDSVSSTTSATTILGSGGNSYYEGQTVYANTNFSSAGDSQYSVLILREVTTQGQTKNISPVPPPVDQMPNFRPYTKGQIWSGKLKLCAVNNLGQSIYLEYDLIGKRASDGTLAWTSITLNSIYNVYGASVNVSNSGIVLLQLGVTAGGINPWYWTGVFEFIDLLY